MYPYQGPAVKVQLTYANKVIPLPICHLWSNTTITTPYHSQMRKLTLRITSVCRSARIYKSSITELLQLDCVRTSNQAIDHKQKCLIRKLLSHLPFSPYVKQFVFQQNRFLKKNAYILQRQAQIANIRRLFDSSNCKCMQFKVSCFLLWFISFYLYFYSST